MLELYNYRLSLQERTHEVRKLRETLRSTRDSLKLLKDDIKSMDRVNSNKRVSAITELFQSRTCKKAGNCQVSTNNSDAKRSGANT